VSLTQRGGQLLDLGRQGLFPPGRAMAGAFLERLLAAGQELLTPLRHRHLRRRLPPGCLGDRHLAPQHRQDDPNLVCLRLL
jgi:hypothetical protein